MLIPKLTAKYFTSVLLMVKEDLLSTLSSAPMELYSTKIISSVIGGSILIVPKQKPFILSMKTLQQSERQIHSQVLQTNLNQVMVLLRLQITNMQNMT